MDKKEILITGGTGSLSRALLKQIKTNFKPRGIRLYSRGELKQHETKVWLKEIGLDCSGVSFLVGDVRDKDRLSLACQGVDIIINCAALKRIEVAEDDPLECIKTNIHGVENVIYAAIENSVEKVFHISTDKAVYPTTLYGSTKKCAEDLIIRANIYSKGAGIPRFSCARYGNVFGSNGSVIQLFKAQQRTGTLTITDQRMTRFWITLEQVASFITDRIQMMKGGEIFVPKMPSMSIIDIAKTIAPDAKIKIVGIRGMEKLHECLITEEESTYCRLDAVFGDFYVIDKNAPEGDERWTYSSNTNNWQLTREELRKMLEDLR